MLPKQAFIAEVRRAVAAPGRARAVLAEALRVAVSSVDAQMAYACAEKGRECRGLTDAQLVAGLAELEASDLLGGDYDRSLRLIVDLIAGQRSRPGKRRRTVTLDVVRRRLEASPMSTGTAAVTIAVCAALLPQVA